LILHFLPAYASGLLCASFLDFSLLFVVLPFATAPLWYLFHHRRWSFLLLWSFFLTLGFARYHLAVTPPAEANHIRTFVSERIIAVEGIVTALSSRPEGRTVIDVQTSKVISGGIAAPTAGPLRLHVQEGTTSTGPGDNVRFMARLRAPRAFGTPGEFDYPRHLAAQGIFVTASISDAGDIVPLAKTGQRSGLSIGEIRLGISRRIDQAVLPSVAPLVRALVIGDKGGVTSEQ
jgi:competence protein ComEC